MFFGCLYVWWFICGLTVVVLLDVVCYILVQHYSSDMYSSSTPHINTLFKNHLIFLVYLKTSILTSEFLFFVVVVLLLFFFPPHCFALFWLMMMEEFRKLASFVYLKSYSVLKTWHNQILESDNCDINITCINILMIISVIKNMVESSLHWERYMY